MSARGWLRSSARDHAYDVIAQEHRTEEPQGGPCPTCGEHRPYGHVPRGPACECDRQREGELIAEYEREHVSEFVDRVLAEADIPRRYAECSFDGFKLRKGTEEAFTATKAWAEAFTLDTDCGLSFFGEFGSGKTHLAVAALRRAIKGSLVDGKYVSAGDLVGKVRGGSGINWTPVEDAIRAELLVLDDLGMEAGTDFTRDVVARVLFGRYEAARPTIVTSNHGPAAITRLFGGGITSRLREMTDTIVLKATDYRAEKRAS